MNTSPFCPGIAGLLLGVAVASTSAVLAEEQHVSSAGASGVVQAMALSDDTSVGLFVLGRTRDHQPYGGEGTIEPGPPAFASMRFRGVPEGNHVVDFVGYASRSFIPPNPVSFPADGFCARDIGTDFLSVVSDGRVERTRIESAQTDLECVHTGMDRYIVNSDYLPDATHPWFGSTNGDNVVTLYLDDWGVGARIEVDVDTGNNASPLGLFAALPDTAGGESWPDPADWNFGTLMLTADANGDALCHLVVKPQERPVLWEIMARNTDSGESASGRVWITTQAGAVECTSPLQCDDGDPCTVDDCDPTGSCTNLPRLDGTSCGAGMVWDGDECVTGVRLDPIGMLTGDCSNTGGANLDFPWMRCGNSSFVGPFEVTYYPALTFDLSVLPAGETIHSAVLHVLQERVDGDNPYTGDMREVIVEHVRFNQLFGCDQFDPVTGTIGQRLLSTDAELDWRTVDISEAVLVEVALSSDDIQLRFQFVPAMTDGDGEDDLAVFTSDNATQSCQRPFVVIRLEP